MTEPAPSATSSPTSSLISPLDRQRLAVGSAAIVTALAGGVHLALVEEHFEEGFLFGVAFLAMAVYQLVVAILLVARSGPVAYRAGIWGSGLIVATYVVTRVLPPPTAAAPEPVTPLGVAATTLELAALVLLVTILPDTPGPSRPRSRLPVALAVALGVPPLWVFVTGGVQWVDPSPWPTPQTPQLQWGVFGPIGQLSPALYGWLTDRLYLFLPWWVGPAAIGLGVLAGANVWLASRLRRERRISCRRWRLSLFGLLPAAFAATVCCGVPLAALFGLSTASLFAGAPFATATSIGLLAANLAWLVHRQGAAPGEPC